MQSLLVGLSVTEVHIRDVVTDHRSFVQCIDPHTMPVLLGRFGLPDQCMLCAIKNHGDIYIDSRRAKGDF